MVPAQRSANNDLKVPSTHRAMLLADNRYQLGAAAFILTTDDNVAQIVAYICSRITLNSAYHFSCTDHIGPMAVFSVIAEFIPHSGEIRLWWSIPEFRDVCRFTSARSAKIRLSNCAVAVMQNFTLCFSDRSPYQFTNLNIER